MAFTYLSVSEIRIYHKYTVHSMISVMFVYLTVACSYITFTCNVTQRARDVVSLETLLHAFIGDDGNLAKLDQCNFTGNTGFGSQLDFGAAVALSYLTVFRQQVISPRHEIKDW